MTARAFSRSIGIAVGCSALAAAGCDSFELPEPPNVSYWVRAYEQPSGQLDANTVQSIAALLIERADLTRDRVPLDVTSQLVGEVQDVGEDEVDFRDDEGVRTIAGSRIDIAAMTRVHHVCMGWEAQPSTDAAQSGRVELTMTVDRRGMIPTVWGYFDRCRLRHGDYTLELDGDLALHFGANQPRLALSDLRRVPYLVLFEGRLIVWRADQRVEVHSSFSFRVLPTGELHLSVSLPDGTNVVGVFDPPVLRPAYREPALRAGVRTRDREWQCEIDRGRGSCADLANAAEVVRW